MISRHRRPSTVQSVAVIAKAAVIAAKWIISAAAAAADGGGGVACGGETGSAPLSFRPHPRPHLFSVSASFIPLLMIFQWNISLYLCACTAHTFFSHSFFKDNSANEKKLEEEGEERPSQGQR